MRTEINILEYPLEMTTAELLDQAPVFGPRDKFVPGRRGTTVLLCLVAGQSHPFKPGLVGNTSWSMKPNLSGSPGRMMLYQTQSSANPWVRLA